MAFAIFCLLPANFQKIDGRADREVIRIANVFEAYDGHPAPFCLINNNVIEGCERKRSKRTRCRIRERHGSADRANADVEFQLTQQVQESRVRQPEVCKRLGKQLGDVAFATILRKAILVCDDAECAGAQHKVCV